MGNLNATSEEEESPVVTRAADIFARRIVDRAQFGIVYKLCKEILDKSPGAEDYVLPTQKAEAVGVWDHLQPWVNNWRFMVYIVWLKGQENSFEEFCKLKKERKESFEGCFTRLREHVKNLETICETKKELAGTV